MDIRSILCKITGWVLVIAIVLNVILWNIPVKGTDAISQKEKLGSPLLDAGFMVEDWAPKELAVWGIYLSNFCAPLLDDYASAFSMSSKNGTKGRGYKMLAFGADGSIGETTVKELVNAAVEMQQSAGIRQLYVREIEASTFEAGDWEEAHAIDFVNLEGNHGSKQNLYGSRGKKYTSVTKTAQFAIKDGDQYHVVFNILDGWDAMSLMVCWASACFDRDFGEDFQKAFSDADSTDSYESLKLVMDAFGNICCQSGKRNIILYPACMSQYVTTNKQYNLVNSLVLNGRFLSSSKDGAVGAATFYKEHLSEKIGKSNSPIPEGTVVMYHSVQPYTEWRRHEQDEWYNVDTAKYDENVPYVSKVMNGSKSYGSFAWKVIQSDLTDKNKKIKAPIKFAVSDADAIDTTSNVGWRWPPIYIDEGSLETLVDYCNANVVFLDPDVSMLTSIDCFGKLDLQMFDSPAVTISYDYSGSDNKRYITADTSKDMEEWQTAKYFMQYVGDVVHGKISSEAGAVQPDLTEGKETLFESLIKDGSGKISTLFGEFLRYRASAPKGTTLETLRSLTESDYKESSLSGTTFENVDLPDTGGHDSASVSDMIESYYTKSKDFETVYGYFHGTSAYDGELATVAKWVYYTYLKWYGVISSDYKNELSPIVFPDGSPVFTFDAKKLTDGSYMTEEDKRSEVLDKTYLMLDPEKGKDLRKQIYMNSFTDIIFEWYNRTVYGSASFSATEDSNGGVAASAASQGFLGVDNYYTNPLTSWFVNIYDDIVIILLGVGLLIILLVWVLTKKKPIWVFTSMILLVNVVLITPSLGDIVPYVSDKVIMSSFTKQLNYWALCENVENMKIENSTEVLDINGNPVTDQTLSALISDLQFQYSDRALLLKYDISRKVTSAGVANYDELQNLRSTAWLLPQIIRQYSAEDGSADYVYVSMSDALKGARQLYGAYRPRTEKDVSATQMDMVATSESQIRSQLYPDLIGFDYTSQFSADSSDVITMGWGIQPYASDINQSNLHKVFFYMSCDDLPSGITIPSVNLGDRDSKGKLKSELDATIQGSLPGGCADNLRTFSSSMERYGGLYNNYDNSTVRKEYGYMWLTESPLIYMYMNMKDTYMNYTEIYSDMQRFTMYDPSGVIISTAMDTTQYGSLGINDNSHVQNIAKMIQGEYINGTIDDLDGNRANFMYDGITGYTKDFLDLRYLVSNVVPYLYKVQLITGGIEGDQGIFKDEKISGYSLYKNNRKSWMYRSNWAEKIMTNQEFNTPFKIGLPGGGKATVERQIDPASYEAAGRPMVFSEAEMERLGLTEKDLSLVELKCLEVNKNTAREITMLLNYINMDGVTYEAMVQQMALLGTIEFCQIMSPDNGFNNQMALYPQNVDLKNISFDAVMRVMMLGATKDSYYTYGNTMYNLIANSDIICSILLLLAAWICVSIIPFTRNILMALLLFLGLWSTLTNFIIGSRARWKVTVSYAVNLVIFLATNVIYYAILSALMTITSPTDILRDGAIGMSVSSPMVVLFMLTLLSGAFVVAAVMQIIFTLKNYKDMGATMFGIMLTGLTDKIAGGIQALGDKLHAGSGGGAGGTSADGSLEGGTSNSSKRKKKKKNSGSDDGDPESGDRDDKDDSDSSDSSESETSGYTDSSAMESDRDEEADARDIDEKIDKGKEKEKEEREKESE